MLYIDLYAFACAEGFWVRGLATHLKENGSSGGNTFVH